MKMSGKDMSEERKHLIDQGRIETRNLAECLAVDQRILALLRPYSTSADPLVRRLAIEIFRPRGVWCKHIARLKAEPHLAEALLVPLLAEADKYPQDSVANWLNDASKTRPDWVRELFERYLPSCKASMRVYSRATRNMPLVASG